MYHGRERHQYSAHAETTIKLENSLNSKFLKANIPWFRLKFNSHNHEASPFIRRLCMCTLIEYILSQYAFPVAPVQPYIRNMEFEL